MNSNIYNDNGYLNPPLLPRVGEVGWGLYGIDLPNNNLYNGKELQPDYDLQWYDYGARFYDPQLGRFHTVDPLAEDYNNQSHYLYAFNNPIRYIDYMGLGAEDEVAKDKDKQKDEEAKKKEEEKKKETEKKKEDEKKKEVEKKKEEEKIKKLEEEKEEDNNPAGKIFKTGMAAALVLTVDPVPGDEVAVAVATLVTAGVAWAGHEINQFAHRKNARPSTQDDHQKGEARDKKNREGSKGEKFTKGPRPPNVKGPWPRKIKR